MVSCTSGVLETYTLQIKEDYCKLSKKQSDRILKAARGKHLITYKGLTPPPNKAITEFLNRNFAGQERVG